MNFLKNLYENKEALYKFSKNIRFFSGNVLIIDKEFFSIFGFISKIILLMKKALYMFFLLFVLTFQIQAQKVGLVLSGGGAKGLTHIGIIRALEENHIPNDYIAGTSMGAIVG